CRGFFRDTMGAEGRNDRGIYDDAIFVVLPDRYVGFTANTDPSRFRQGVACLVPGVYPDREGVHKGPYWAWRPEPKGEELPVTQDGVADPEPGVAINIHKGSYTTTSSLGCQTIYPDQWDQFRSEVYRAMDDACLRTVQYCLVVRQG